MFPKLDRLLGPDMNDRKEKSSLLVAECGPPRSRRFHCLGSLGRKLPNPLDERFGGKRSRESEIQVVEAYRNALSC